MSKDYLAAGPSRGLLPGRQRLAAVVFIACAQLATLALAAGPYPQRGQRLFLALLACAPILLLRRWLLAVLAAATAANVLVMALGNASSR